MKIEGTYDKKHMTYQLVLEQSRNSNIGNDILNIFFFFFFLIGQGIYFYASSFHLTLLYIFEFSFLNDHISALIKKMLHKKTFGEWKPLQKYKMLLFFLAIRERDHMKQKGAGNHQLAQQLK